MRRLVLVTVVAGLAMAAPGAATAASGAPVARAPVAPARVAPAPVAELDPAGTLVAFHSHFGFARPRSRGYGFGGVSRGRSRHPLLRRVVKTAIWLYVLHLFFSHGGLSILLWIVIIGLVVSLLRRRRRRYAY